MHNIGMKGIHYLQKLNAANVVPSSLIENGQKRVIDASLTLIRERAKLKGELVRALGGATASASLLGVPLGHNSSFLQGPAFAPPRIREAIWCGSTNSATEEGKELNDPRVLTDVGDVPVQEIRDCGVDDDRLMNIISDSVKLVMEQDPLRPLVLGGDHSISFPVVRAVSEKLGGPVDILHLDAHPDIYHAFEGNKYSHASSFARIMEGGFARRLLQAWCKGVQSFNLADFFPIFDAVQPCCAPFSGLDTSSFYKEDDFFDPVWEACACVHHLAVDVGSLCKVVDFYDPVWEAYEAWYGHSVMLHSVALVVYCAKHTFAFKKGSLSFSLSSWLVCDMLGTTRYGGRICGCLPVCLQGLKFKDEFFKEGENVMIRLDIYGRCGCTCILMEYFK